MYDARARPRARRRRRRWRPGRAVGRTDAPGRRGRRGRPGGPRPGRWQDPLRPHRPRRRRGDDQEPADYYFDDGRPEGETGRLVGFVCGDVARRWAARSADDRRDALTAQLTSVFEDDRFATPTDYLDRAWTTEPYSRGAYHGYPTPGTMTACWDAIRDPVGRIHWAGAETDTRWYGHVDGAIRSGERAAAEIRDCLA